MEFQINSITNSMTAKQVTIGIINEFLIPAQMIGAKQALTD
jgi:hypothetical protein